MKFITKIGFFKDHIMFFLDELYYYYLLALIPIFNLAIIKLQQQQKFSRIVSIDSIGRGIENVESCKGIHINFKNNYYRFKKLKMYLTLTL